MGQIADVLNLDDYFQRIGYTGDRTPSLPTLQSIHRCHTRAIAFENLNSFLGQPVHLDLASLQQKLIYEGRGGYCFEQNSLFRAVLMALGFQVKGLAARVLWNVPEGITTPRTHMLLHIDMDGTPYIADVGFGGVTLTEPLQLVLHGEQPTSHEPFRFVQADLTSPLCGDDVEHRSIPSASNSEAWKMPYTMQVKLGEQWQSLYYFDLQEQQHPDYEVSNWYVSTHPQSIFVTSLIAARVDHDRRYALRNNQFTTHHLNGPTERRELATVAELCHTLERVFRLSLPAIATLESSLQRLM